MNYPKLIEFAKRVYAQNVELGWWDTPRPYATVFDLIHSELSEAMEGHRKSLKDDKLPKYPMMHVEIVDTFIRVLDTMVGYSEIQEPVYVSISCENSTDFNTLNMGCRKLINNAYDELCTFGGHPDDSEFLDLCWCIIAQLIHMSEVFKFDIMAIAEEKLAFNSTRSDHRRENRNKPNGKAY